MIYLHTEEKKKVPGHQHILITGMPGSGKTTLFKRLVDEFQHLNPVGFYTAEIRQGRSRTGFRLCGLDGRSGTLAHVDLHTGYRVGRYGVDVNGFEAFLKKLPFSTLQTGLVMIDEIGKMECFCPEFVKATAKILSGNIPLVATVSMHGKGLIDDVKKRDDIELITVTSKNREELPSLLYKKLGL